MHDEELFVVLIANVPCPLCVGSYDVSYDVGFVVYDTINRCATAVNICKFEFKTFGLPLLLLQKDLLHGIP